jgi:hypothetical protein
MNKNIKIFGETTDPTEKTRKTSNSTSEKNIRSQNLKKYQENKLRKNRSRTNLAAKSTGDREYRSGIIQANEKIADPE